MSHEFLRWGWPLAARAAFELEDTAATAELLALLGACQPGHLAPMQRAERDLVRARGADHEDDQDAGTAFAAAVNSLRELSTPYHLAHGLLDYAHYLQSHNDSEAAAAAVEEASALAVRLRCQPLLDRAADLAPAEPQAQPELAALEVRPGTP
jgi:hypothetical protein